VVVGTTALLPVDGVNTGILGVRQARGSLLPALLSGRLPAGPDEIALGRSLAERLDVGVGDEVAVGAASGPLVCKTIRPSRPMVSNGSNMRLLQRVCLLLSQPSSSAHRLPPPLLHPTVLMAAHAVVTAIAACTAAWISA